MIKIPLDQLIFKIKESTKLSEEEINSKIKAKMDQLSGLISKEGAAHIIANELNVKLFTEGKQKIIDIHEGIPSVETLGKITNIFNVNEFTRKDGAKGKVGSFVIADETGRMRIVLWNDQTDLIQKMKVDDIIKIKNGYVKKQMNNPGVEVHMSNKSEIMINPENETVGEVMQRQKAERKQIENLNGSEANIELMGTIVQIFEPRYYEVCPECNKRARQKENKFSCDSHGIVDPDYSYVMNLILDDGTGTIRTVFFRNQLANLLKMEAAEVMKYKDAPAEFQSVKNDLLGKIIKVVGRSTKNEMFDRVEFISQLVFSDLDPDEELKKLEEEAKVIE